MHFTVGGKRLVRLTASGAASDDEATLHHNYQIPTLIGLSRASVLLISWSKHCEVIFWVERLRSKEQQALSIRKIGGLIS